MTPPGDADVVTRTKRERNFGKRDHVETDHTDDSDSEFSPEKSKASVDSSNSDGSLPENDDKPHNASGSPESSNHTSAAFEEPQSAAVVDETIPATRQSDNRCANRTCVYIADVKLTDVFTVV